MKTIRLITLFTIVLFATFAKAQSVKAPESTEKNGSSLNLPEPKPAPEIEKVKVAIAYLLKEKVEVFDRKNQLSGIPKELVVFDDRIEFKIENQNTVIYFTDLPDEVILPPSPRKSKIVLSLVKFEFIAKGFSSDLKRLVELRQNLLFMQTHNKVLRDESQRILWEQKASAYRAMTVKPQVSEEQRKLIVQANLFNQQKNYIKAIELYTKASEVDQTAYPAGYSNLALLQAQINNFGAAINYMKKYLLLEPEASDARSAQDKIYEWEAMITN